MLISLLKNLDLDYLHLWMKKLGIIETFEAMKINA